MSYNLWQSRCRNCGERVECTLCGSASTHIGVCAELNEAINKEHRARDNLDVAKDNLSEVAWEEHPERRQLVLEASDVVYSCAKELDRALAKRRALEETALQMTPHEHVCTSTPKRIVRCTVVPPKSPLNDTIRIRAAFEEGAQDEELFSAPVSVGFQEDEFVGLTMGEARTLYEKRYPKWYQW